MKPVCYTFLLLTISMAIFGHEFWMDPQKFMYKPGQDIIIRFWVGENFEGNNWSGNNSKVQSLNIYTANFSDTLNQLISDEKGDSALVALFDEGTPAFTLQTTNSHIDIEAPKFNEYLKEDGLQNAIDYRLVKNQTDSAGHEYYQRSVKTIVQIGEQKDNGFAAATSLPLDITPVTNPYNIKPADSISVKILYRQQPLANYQIKVWHRHKNITVQQNMISDANGIIKFAITNNGKWMVSTVKMEHIENDPQAQWQSYWGSCTWGYY